MRFLISRLSSLGDVVCSLPAAVALSKSYPGCHITWVVSPAFKGIVESCSAVTEVITAKPGFSPSTWPVIEGEYDAAFDLQGLLKSALVLGRSRAKKKLGYYWQREGASFFSKPVFPDSTSLHVVDQYVDVVRAFGAEVDRAEFSLSALPPAVESLSKTWPQQNERPYAVLNPGAGWESKRWPAASFAELIVKLDSLAVTSVIIGGKAEADLAARDQVLALCSVKPVDLVGKTSLTELIALIEKATLHVGGDTGSSHLAAALSRPAIGLYGPTKPVRSCPYGQISRCLYNPSGLGSISAQSVIEKVEEVLS